MMAITLNRPRVLNTLNLEMIRLLRQAFDEALSGDDFQFVLLLGAGDQGFCAGGDLKALAQAVRDREISRADEFFREEYALDLLINQFTKPVLVLADGVTMGGGLGLAAGAALVLATERTRIAMPETRIGFFPDVGATGWLFEKCPPGYPEYLALTGYEMRGEEAVRLGLATHLTQAALLPETMEALAQFPGGLPSSQEEAVGWLTAYLAGFFEKNIPARPEMDAWVATHFAGKASLGKIMESLSRCSLEDPQVGQLCAGVFQRLSERSPTALHLTLKLLRLNEGRPLPEVLATEARAAHFMVQHPDYLEGIRARILDKDDRPRWRPATLEEAAALPLEF
jgi:enoyl-CoA hydratase/carnithine racemase